MGPLALTMIQCTPFYAGPSTVDLVTTRPTAMITAATTAPANTGS